MLVWWAVPSRVSPAASRSARNSLANRRSRRVGVWRRAGTSVSITAESSLEVCRLANALRNQGWRSHVPKTQDLCYHLGHVQDTRKHGMCRRAGQPTHTHRNGLERVTDDSGHAMPSPNGATDTGGAMPLPQARTAQEHSSFAQASARIRGDEPAARHAAGFTHPRSHDFTIPCTHNPDLHRTPGHRQRH
jgi:hypothetical protein